MPWPRIRRVSGRALAAAYLVLLAYCYGHTEVDALRVRDIKVQLGIDRNVDTSRIFDKKYYGLWDDMCHQASAQLQGGVTLDDTKFSVLISTFRRVKLTEKLLGFYASNPYVAHIYVTWMDINKPAPQFPPQRVPVTVLEQTVDSLNNRFNPILGLNTSAVLISDDDIETESMDDISFGFKVWQENKDRLVGYFPRSTVWDEELKGWKYKITDKIERDSLGIKPYSIMLTKLEFMHSKYLFLYRCMMKRAVPYFIDKNMNCEDIAMNFLVSGVTQKPPLAILTWNKLIDYGLGNKSGSIWGKVGHFDIRSECVNKFIDIFGGNLLIDTQFAAGRFRNTWWEERETIADN